jgi:nitroreductase
METKDFREYFEFEKLSDKEMINRSESFNFESQKRRTVRDFSDDEIPIEILENCILSASSAPSGANLQPYHFVIVKSPSVKKEIRSAAEKEEEEFYTRRASKEWLDVLEPLGTDPSKPFLEEAPYLIAVFEKKYYLDEEGVKRKTYYSKESTGIAVGTLISALHFSGVASLTHTPSPMNFLNEILERPENERPFLILVVGKPKEGVKVPDIKRKSLSELVSIV